LAAALSVVVRSTAAEVRVTGGIGDLMFPGDDEGGARNPRTATGAGCQTASDCYEVLLSARSSRVTARQG